MNSTVSTGSNANPLAELSKGQTDIDVGLIGPAYLARSPQLDLQECINLYPEVEQGSSKDVVALIGTPGTNLFATLPAAGSLRGMHTTTTNRFFAVCGATLFEIYKDGRWVTRGGLSTIINPVSMADNGTEGNQLIIFDGVNGYVLNLLTNVLTVNEKNVVHSDYVFNPDGTPVLDATGNQVVYTWVNDCPAATHVIFKDGWFIANNKGTGRFFLSNLYDGTKWNPLLFATAEGSPDNITSLTRTNNEIWFFGPQSIEVWYASATAIPAWLLNDQSVAAQPVNTFPFARVPNAFLDFGTESPYSVATNGNDVFFLGSNIRGHNALFHMRGYEPERISTHGIEYQIDNMPRTDDARAFCYQQEGHFFYEISFPTADKTFVYDMTTGLWHERQTYDDIRNIGHMHRIFCHAYWNGMHLVGDSESPLIYELDLDTYTDNGHPIQRIRTTPHIHDKMQRIFHYDFELDIEKGGPYNRITETDFQNNVTYRAPRALLSWSDDRGETWKGERWESLGDTGDFKLRIHWHMLGQSRSRIYKLVISDPIKVVIIASHVRMETENE